MVTSNEQEWTVLQEVLMDQVASHLDIQLEVQSKLWYSHRTVSGTLVGVHHPSGEDSLRLPMLHFQAGSRGI